NFVTLRARTAVENGTEPVSDGFDVGEFFESRREIGSLRSRETADCIAGVRDDRRRCGLWLRTTRRRSALRERARGDEHRKEDERETRHDSLQWESFSKSSSRRTSPRRNEYVRKVKPLLIRPVGVNERRVRTFVVALIRTGAKVIALRLRKIFSQIRGAICV